MIYFDNAATTFPKPKSVINEVMDSMKHRAANPGRGGHKMAIEAGEKLYECREELAAFFGLDDPCKVIFTLNATHSLNIVINGLLDSGDHVICTVMDHNSVLRPIWALKDRVECSMLSADDSGEIKVDELEGLIKSNTKLIALSHVSNVCGTVQPIASVIEIAKKHNIPILLDASQSAGLIDIDVSSDNIDFLVCPGHKGLYGPMGTGVLCINSALRLKPFMTGGTGSNSMDLNQPEELPDSLESGTVNFPGICGLAKGVSFIKSIGCRGVLEHEMKLTKFLIDGLSDLKAYRILGKKGVSKRCPVVSIVHDKVPSTAISEYLSSVYGIATRAMYHCAYPSHVALGSEGGGSVRVSFGMFNTIGQIKTLLYALEHINL